MPSLIPGLHHVTAVASDPQRNLDFYTQVLGLRFVKRTVNFDDPGTYHFYFGDDAGTPGTILTFFPWPSAVSGRAGAGEVATIAFSIPRSSVGYWQQRLGDHGVSAERVEKRLTEELLTFRDPDGMKIEIVGHADSGEVNVPRFATVPPEHAIRGLFGVTLCEKDLEDTASILILMGFQKVAEDANRSRFSAKSSALGNHIDLVVDPKAAYGEFGAGSVHHIAFRTTNDATQREWRQEIAKHLNVTPVKDRTYFHSIYFREQGGVLFEIATDPPGFAYDEPLESLGEELHIPAWLEPQRAVIEKTLPAITLRKEAPPLELKTQSGSSI
jgi:glyoxalase family protein